MARGPIRPGSAAAPPTPVRRRRRALTVAASALTADGALGILGGLWFALGDHPFHQDGFAPDVGMTRAQVEATSPRLAEWMLHISHQTGFMTLVWGLFVVVLVWFGLRRGDRLAWAALWLGGLTPLLLMGLAEVRPTEVLASGSPVLVAAHLFGGAAFVVFLAGLLAPARHLLAPGR